MRVLVSGVQGNTAANGIFAVTVTGPSSFTLNGSAGNAAWTGGGAVTANLDTMIQTIVIAALATATSTTAVVVTPVLTKTGVLPFGAATIAALLAQTPVDPSQFPTLIAASTQVAKAAALFTALAPGCRRLPFWFRMRLRSGWLDPERPAACPD